MPVDNQFKTIYDDYTDEDKALYHQVFGVSTDTDREITLRAMQNLQAINAPKPAPQAVEPTSDKPFYDDWREFGKQLILGGSNNLEGMVGGATVAGKNLLGGMASAYNMQAGINAAIDSGGKTPIPTQADQQKYQKEGAATAEVLGRDMMAASDERAQGSLKPDLEGRGKIAKFFLAGAPSVLPSVGAIFAPEIMLPVFGGSQYTETSDRVLKDGGSAEDAHKAGLLSGTVEAGGELAAAKIAKGLFYGAKSIGIGNAKTMGEVLAKSTDPRVIVPFLKTFGMSAAGEAGTEAAQNVIEEAIAREYGAKAQQVQGDNGQLREQTYGDIASESATAALSMSVIMGGLAAPVQIQHSRQAKAVSAALNGDQGVNRETRLMVLGKLYGDAKQAGVKDADEWLQSATQDVMADKPVQSYNPDNFAGEAQPAAQPAPTPEASQEPSDINLDHLESMVSGLQSAVPAAADVVTHTGDPSDPSDRFKFELNQNSSAVGNLRARIDAVKAEKQAQLNAENERKAAEFEAQSKQFQAKVDQLPAQSDTLVDGTNSAENLFSGIRHISTPLESQAALPEPENDSPVLNLRARIDAFNARKAQEGAQQQQQEQDRIANDNEALQRRVDNLPAPHETILGDNSGGESIFDSLVKKNSNKINDAKIDEKINARLPDGFKDFRMLRQPYREYLSKAAGDLDAIANGKAPTVKGADSLLDLAAKNGGLNRSVWESEGVDPQSMRVKPKDITNPIFRKDSGMTADDLAELAAQHGYTGKNGAPLSNADIVGMVTDEVNGLKKHFSPDNAEKVAQLLGRSSAVNAFDSSVHPAAATKAISKALAGEPLTERQAAIVSAALDHAARDTKDIGAIQAKWEARRAALQSNDERQLLDAMEHHNSHDHQNVNEQEALLTEAMADAINRYGVPAEVVKNGYDKYASQSKDTNELLARMSGFLRAHINERQRSSGASGSAQAQSGLFSGEQEVPAGERSRTDSPFARTNAAHDAEVQRREWEKLTPAEQEDHLDAIFGRSSRPAEVLSMGRVVHKYGVTLHDKGDVISGNGADLVILYHGTDSEGWNRIYQSGRISMGSGFSPRLEVAQDFAGINKENDEYYVIKVRVPKSRLVVDPESYDDSDVDNAISDGISMYVDGDVVLPKEKPKHLGEPEPNISQIEQPTTKENAVDSTENLDKKPDDITDNQEPAKTEEPANTGDSTESVEINKDVVKKPSSNSNGVLNSLGKNETTKKSIPFAESKAVIEKLKSSWKGAADIRLVESLDDLPSDVRQRLDADGKTIDNVQGIYNPKTGSIYLNANKITSAKHTEQLVFHEAYTHLGLTKLFGNDVSSIMGRLYLAMGGQAGINQLADKYKIDLSRYEKLYKNERADYRNAVIAEELLAHIAENPKPKVIQIFKELIGEIKAWLRKNGFAELSKVSDNDIQHLLKQARETITKGKGGDTTGLIYSLSGLNNSNESALKYSLNGLPENSRKIIGSDPLLAGWTMLAQHDDAFKLPISNKKDLVDIFNDLEGDRGYRAERDDTVAKTSNTKAFKGWYIRIPVSESQQKRMAENGDEPKKFHKATVMQNGKAVWINISDSIPGADGKRVYNAVANYAYNNGLVFIGDPEGLSDIALSRRLENMASSALKFGTTKHLWPHDRQLLGDKILGVPEIKWKDGDDTHNLRELITASYNATKNQFPEIENLRYNPVEDRFEYQDSGEEATANELDKLASDKRNEPAKKKADGKHELAGGSGVGVTITAGRRSLERAVFTHTLLRGTRQEQSQLLAKLSVERPKRLTGEENAILYSLENENKTRSQGGFSVSGLSKSVKESTLLKTQKQIEEMADRELLDDDVKQAYDALGDKSETFVDKLKTLIKRELKPSGLLTDNVYKLKVERDASINEGDYVTEHQTAEFKHTIQSAYGKPIQELSQRTQSALNQAMRGETPAEPIPKAVADQIQIMRDEIKKLSRTYMKQLVADVENLATEANKIKTALAARDAGNAESDEEFADLTDAALNEAFEEKATKAANKLALVKTMASNLDTYLHRSYRAFDDENWPNKVPPKVFNAAVDYLANQYADGAPVTPELRQKAIKKAHLMLHEGKAFDSMGAFITESKLGAKDLSVLKKRQEIAPEIRALLGEYEDVQMNFAKTMTKMTRLIHNHEFLNRLQVEGFKSGLLFDKENRAFKATKKIAGDQSEVYAPLNGLYTTPQFAQALVDALGKEKMPWWYRAIISVNGLVKFNKTVLAPTTAMRNFWSAMFTVFVNGHFNLGHIKQSIESARTYFKGRGDAVEYMKKMRKLGVVYDSPYAAEMMELLKDSRMDEFLSHVLDNKAITKVRGMVEFAQKFYSFGDDFWKIVGFENEKSMLMKYRGMGEAEAEKAAAERIRQTYPTYSMTPKFVNALRRFPLVGTFVSFPAEIIRTSYNITTSLAAEIKEHGLGDPLVQRRAAGFMIGTAAIAALGAASRALVGVGDDEDDAIRMLSPEWTKNSNILYLGRNEKGQLRTMDMSWVDPYNYFKRPFMAFMRGQSAGDALQDGTWELLKPFFGTDILFGAVMEVVNNKKQSGGQVYNPESSDALLKISEHLGKAVAPGIVTNIGNMYKATQGQVSASGKRYTVEEELAALAGFRANTFEPKVALYYQTYQFEDKKRNASTILSSVMRDPNKVSEDELKSAFENAKSSRDRAYTDFEKVVSAARASGMTDLQIIITLRNSGVNAADAQAMAKGIVPKWKLSSTLTKGAAKRASVLFDEETKNELKRRGDFINKLNQMPSTGVESN